MNILISIEKLLSGNFVEGEKMEFKKGESCSLFKELNTSDSMGGSIGGSIGGSMELTGRQQEIIYMIASNNKIREQLLKS